jgi:hypothetical protein
MIYLKKFETTNQYNAYTADTTNFIKPNVSFIEETHIVDYNPYEDPYKGHPYVEIGGLKWATMNIGANSVTDYGLYFQWGDTQGYTASQVGSGEGKKYFGWSDTKYWTSDTGSGSSGFTKYNSTDGKTVLDASDDAVQANWGGEWRMPTKEEFAALGNAIDYIDADGNIISGTDKRTTLNGVLGLYVADKTDHSKRLFFPAAGYCDSGSVSDVGSNGCCWSSSLNSSYVQLAYSLGFGSSYVNWLNRNYRCNGFTVRGVVG